MSDPVGDQRGAAVGQERRRQAGQRDQPGDAADDDEDLQRERDRQARRRAAVPKASRTARAVRRPRSTRIA